MARWKYLLVIVGLLSWLAKLALNDISDAADWFWYLSLACWVVLFSLIWPALFRRNWRELAVFFVTLVVTAFPIFGIGDEIVDRLQDELFRVYILYSIGSQPFEDFLSKCNLIHYTEDDGTEGTIGQCNEDLRSAKWFLFSVIYDPTGQLALPSYRRSTPWRLAVDDNFIAGAVIKRLDGKHLRGDFYYMKIYKDQF